MAKMRKTEKMVEIHEFYIVRSASGSLPALCSACAVGDAIMVAPEQAAAMTQVPARMIYRSVEAGMIHYREQSDGSLIVCLKSLQASSGQVWEVIEEQVKRSASDYPNAPMPRKPFPSEE